MADTADDAYDRLLDRLLASPRYGERWGRHWLDVAGYADSEGYTAEDSVRKDAYKYRDYVIRSFNADKPFDRLRSGTAGRRRDGRAALRKPDAGRDRKADGDRLPPHGAGRHGLSTSISPLRANQVVADTLKIVSTSLLGLTVGCAQCHRPQVRSDSPDGLLSAAGHLRAGLRLETVALAAGSQVSLYTGADRKKAQEIEAEAAKIDAERLKKQEEYIGKTLEKEIAKLPEAIRDRHARPAARSRRCGRRSRPSS